MAQCRECGDELVKGESWYPSQVKLNHRICKECHKTNVRKRQRAHREEIKGRNHQGYRDSVGQIKRCRKCDVELIKGENWHPSSAISCNYICKKCHIAYGRQWRKVHFDYHRQYCEIHKERKNERLRQWCKDNAGRLRTYNYEYQKNHRLERRGYTHKRNALKASLPATLTNEEWQEILEKYDHRCAYCSRNDLPLEQEHKIPVSRGGGYTADNIVPACQPCNKRKGAKTYSEFVKLLAAEAPHSIC